MEGHSARAVGHGRGRACRLWRDDCRSLRREVREELGITEFTPEAVAVYEFRSERERELVHVYRAVCDGPVRPSGELDGGRFWSVSEIRENLGKGIFTPNFEGEIGLILD